MRHSLLRNPVVLIWILLATACASSSVSRPSGPAEETDLRSLILQPLPEWAQDFLYQGYYLDIDRVMETDKLTRFEAVELQNQMRDVLEQDAKASIRDAYDRAIVRIRAGQFEGGWKPRKFARPDDFVLVLDMDETLLSQWYASGKSGYRDLTVSPDGGGPVRSSPYVKFAPGVEEFLRRMKRHPRCQGIVVFTGKADVAAHEIVQNWKFSNGQPVSQFIDAVFARNHLVVGKRSTVPSKDLRIIDPELEHVVLVDDNPSRVLQPQVLRAQPKFDADAYRRAETTRDSKLVSYYRMIFPNLAGEIEETARAARDLKIPFSQAFLPYSYSGVRVFQSLLHQMPRSEALRITRTRPELQEAAFVFEKKE